MGKTAQLRSSPGPPYLCLRVRSPERACRKQSPREGGGAGGKEGRDPGPTERGRSLPLSQVQRLMAGTVTTRKDARTHARTPDATR